MGADVLDLNSGHEEAEKPSPCASSCFATASCASHAAGVSSNASGQKLMRLKVGRSYWSRWHVTV
jgi:hypothetical protein